MTTVQLIHPGYIRDDSRVGSSISLIRDGSAIVVAVFRGRKNVEVDRLTTLRH